MNIKELIFGSKKKEPKEEDIVMLHDIFMAEYGWIPVDKFKSIPIPTFINLLSKIQERKKREQEANRPKGRH
jgi:hypothetical protein